jgi:hypothetical protein
MKPPLWSNDQSSWLQIQRAGFNSRRYQDFWEAVDLERGPLGLMITTEELTWKKSSSGLENRDYGLGDLSRWPRDSPLSLNLTGGGCSVGIIRSQRKDTELLLLLSFVTNCRRERNKDLETLFAWKFCAAVG